MGQHGRNRNRVERGLYVIMEFYFTDRKFNMLGVVSTDAEAALSLTADKDILSIDAAARNIEGTILFNADSSDQVKNMGQLGNFILYKDERGKSVFMTIMDMEHDPKNGEHYFSAEDAGMDLINGLVGPYNATKAMTFAQYFNAFAGGMGFKIGINEISNLSRTLNKRF